MSQNRVTFGIGSAVLLFLLGNVVSTHELCENGFSSVSYLLLTTFIGWHMLLSFGELKGCTGKFLSYVGVHTLPILILHVLVFKVCSWMLLCVRNGWTTEVVVEGLVAERGFWWCLAFVSAGVLVPLALNVIWRRLVKVLLLGAKETLS